MFCFVLFFNEYHLRDFWDNIKQTNICTIKSKKENLEKGADTYVKK